MQTQLFSSNVKGGRKLLQSGAGMSLADEITNLPKDEVGGASDHFIDSLIICKVNNNHL